MSNDYGAAVKFGFPPVWEKCSTSGPAVSAWSLGWAAARVPNDRDGLGPVIRCVLHECPQRGRPRLADQAHLGEEPAALPHGSSEPLIPFD